MARHGAGLVRSNAGAARERGQAEGHAGSRAPEEGAAEDRACSGRPDSGVVGAERGAASCSAACGPLREKRAAERRRHLDGEVRRAHAGTERVCWVDLFLDEGGECDELMTVREALGA